MEALNPYFAADEAAIPASFTKAWDEWAAKVAEKATPGEINTDWILTNKFYSNIIVEPFHVKYRFYGKDATATVKGLVQLVNEDPEQAFLAFDAVRIKTRTLAPEDDVDFKIVAAEVDDLNSDVIDLTVEPVGLPDYFYSVRRSSIPSPRMSRPSFRSLLLFTRSSRSSSPMRILLHSASPSS